MPRRRYPYVDLRVQLPADFQSFRQKRGGDDLLELDGGVAAHKAADEVGAVGQRYEDCVSNSYSSRGPPP